MNANRRMKYFRTGLILAISLLLWNPVQAAAGAGMGGMADGLVMQEASGKVVETMNSGGYTYALLDKGGVKTWVALPQAEIAVGSEIVCQPGLQMDNFNSPTMNRSFETIIFSKGFAPAGSVVAQAPPASAPPAAAAPAAPAATTTAGKAEGPNAHTIAEIFEKKDSLANQPVTIKARVVKVSRGIMGKNWLHLQDGTGNQAAKTNDLVVTTDSVPELGSLVTITGNLSLNRDFGAGYRYNVIIEGAEVTISK